MISVVIPCHTTPETADRASEGLWYTVAAAASALEDTGKEHEIVAVLNGQYPIPAGLLHDHTHIRAVFCGPGVQSPQAARHAGLRYTSGEHVFFLDAHVIVPPDFFDVVLDDMAETGADFMGTGHRFLGPTFFGCRVAWNEYLWCRKVLYEPPRGSRKPWRAAVHPHGAFCVRRSAYADAGGYWLALKGYGGEETQLCFKLWLTGRSVWVTPNTYHWHWLPPQGRHDTRTFRDEQFARNFLLIAAAYGDVERVRASYRSLSALYWNLEDHFPEMIESVLSSPEVEAERAVVQEGPFKNLDELRQLFRAEGIVD